MTLAEARRIINTAVEAEVAEIDPNQLKEAVGLLLEQGENLEDRVLANQGADLWPRVVGGPFPYQEFTVDPLTKETPGMPPTLGGGEIPTPDEAHFASGSLYRGPAGGEDPLRIDPQFTPGDKPISTAVESRFRKAAINAGMTSGQIDAELSQLRLAVNSATTESARSQTLEMIDGRIADLEAQAVETGPSPIGVAPDYVAQRQAVPRGGEILRGGQVQREFYGVRPRYFEGDEYSAAGLSPGEITRLQKRLEQAGLLDPGSYWPGVLDPVSANAYKGVLGMANQSGDPADAVIDRLIANLPESVKEQRARAELAKKFQAPPYIAPDPATLAQSVRQTVRAQLGREPTDADMAALTGQMSKIYRADYEAEVAVMRSQFDAERQSLETGTYQPPASSVDIDPAARFREIFESRYRPEMDFIQSRADNRDNVENVYESLRTMGSLIGGGR